MMRLYTLGLLTMLSVAACQAEPTAPPSVTTIVDPANALSEELMVSLSLAKNHHHKANLFTNDGQLDKAAHEVQAILKISFPEASPEAEDVKMDARARLASLWLKQGKLDEAMQMAQKGLSEHSRDSFYVANLHTVLGQIYEAIAAGEELGSEARTKASLQAISHFDTSISINNTLLKSIHP